MSKMSNHSKGPWKCLEQGDADEYVLMGNERRWIFGFRQNGEMGLSEQRSNLKMIESAPDMFELLQQIRDSFILNCVNAEDSIKKINEVLLR